MLIVWLVRLQPRTKVGTPIPDFLGRDVEPGPGRVVELVGVKFETVDTSGLVRSGVWCILVVGISLCSSSAFELSDFDESFSFTQVVQKTQ